MTTLIATSSAMFLSLTGFSYSDLVTWTGAKLMLILGAGLGLVDSLIGWIIAIIIITVVVRLIYHGLRWLHILR